MLTIYASFYWQRVQCISNGLNSLHNCCYDSYATKKDVFRFRDLWAARQPTQLKLSLQHGSLPRNYFLYEEIFRAVKLFNITFEIRAQLFYLSTLSRINRYCYCFVLNITSHVTHSYPKLTNSTGKMTQRLFSLQHGVIFYFMKSNCSCYSLH